MIKLPPSSWKNYLRSSLKAILKSTPLAFKNMKPTDIPKAAGVYLIITRKKPYYIGRTVNLRRRIYTNHLMGPPTTSRLKKYLIESGECANKQAAKKFLRKHAVVSWIEVEDMRIRGALEGYFTGVLFPKYGIFAEH